MRIIKRSGSEEIFDISKIKLDVEKANMSVREQCRLTEKQINEVARKVEENCECMNRALNVEEIQDLVENEIMALGAYDIARSYITYRYKRALVR